MMGQAWVFEQGRLVPYDPSWSDSADLNTDLQLWGFHTEAAVVFGRGSGWEIEVLTRRDDGSGSVPGFEFIAIQSIGDHVYVVFIADYPDLLQYLERTVPLSGVALQSTAPMPNPAAE